jgi:soluble cytochrome b562
MGLINEDYCKETPLRENRCDLCGKKLAYIDSPYGAIPSLELFKSFKKDIETKFENKIQHIEKFINDEINEKFIDEEKKLKSSYQEMQKEFEKSQSRISDISQKIDQKFKEKYEKLKEMQKRFNFLIGRTFNGFSEALVYFAESMDSIEDLIKTYHDTKKELVDQFIPKFKKVMKFRENFNKIFPKENVHNIGLQNLNSEKVFELDSQYLSKSEFQDRKKQFNKIWDEISIFKRNKLNEIKFEID